MFLISLLANFRTVLLTFFTWWQPQKVTVTKLGKRRGVLTAQPPPGTRAPPDPGSACSSPAGDGDDGWPRGDTRDRWWPTGKDSRVQNTTEKTYFLSSSSSSLFFSSSFSLACFTASSSPCSTSFSQVSSSTFAIKSFFTTFKACLRNTYFVTNEYSFCLSAYSFTDESNYTVKTE